MHTRLIPAAVALSALALIACSDSSTGPVEQNFRYDLTVSGAVEQTLRGPALFGSETGSGGQSMFAILLGADTSSHTLILGKPGSERPARGSYDIVQAGSGAGWEIIYAISDDEELLGLFLSTSGTLIITESTSRRLRGTLQFEATGFLGDDLENEVTVTVQGTFDARGFGG
jgi:hypothetical protein